MEQAVKTILKREELCEGSTNSTKINIWTEPRVSVKAETKTMLDLKVLFSIKTCK